MTDSGLWLTPAQIALLHQVTIKHVRNLAYRQKWRRIRVGQQVAYSVDDVDRWFLREPEDNNPGHATTKPAPNGTRRDKSAIR